MTITYEKEVTPYGEAIIKTDGDKISVIPIDDSNSDYQAYLNPVEHLTSPSTDISAINVVE